MKKQHLFLLAAVCSVAVFSCKDEEPTPPVTKPPVTKTAAELITMKNWKVNSLTSGATDFWLFVEACNKDNQYKFRSDDSLRIYDMTTKCNGTDPDSTSSFYKLYNNNIQLILNMKLSSTITIDDTTDIVTLDENTLKINTVYSGLPATITFKHP
jgi:hypothetical protein